MISRVMFFIPLLALACTPPPLETAPRPGPAWRSVAASMRRDYVAFEDDPLGVDLGLAAGGEAHDSTINGLLAYRLTLPARVSVGILHWPGTRARYTWLSSAGSSELTQELADSAMAALSRSPRVGRAALLPSLVVGVQPTIAGLRDAGARLQTHVVMIYRPNCALADRTPFVGSTQYRASCTVEAALLDTRSGVIPFSTVVTREYITQRQRVDYDTDGTWRRAQLQALVIAVVEISSRVGTFLATVPEMERE